MLEKCANVRMCKCANCRLYLRIPLAIIDNHSSICILAHLLSICTFTHSHICTFPKHLHISQAFAHFPSICTFSTLRCLQVRH